MDRRNFLRIAAAGAASGSLLGEQARGQTARRVAPSDEIGVGIIGAGSRGQELMRYMLRVPGVRVRALCDVYEPRFAEARKITREETPVYRDHRRMLEAPDLDAIVVATPLSFHAEHMVAALESDRHVYGETSIGLTVDR